MKLVPFNKRRLITRDDPFESFYDVLDDFFTNKPLAHRDLNYDTFKLDIEEKEDKYLVEAELPGIEKDEIDIQFDDGRLTISIEREDSEEVEEKNYIHKERRYSSMQRAIYLDNASDKDIKASLENGVLAIKILKAEKTKEAQKIEIK